MKTTIENYLEIIKRKLKTISIKKLAAEIDIPTTTLWRELRNHGNKKTIDASTLIKLEKINFFDVSTIGICKIEIEKIKNELMKVYGEIYNTNQLTKVFEIENFAMTYVVVRRKKDGKMGTIDFCDNPRFYYNFIEDV